MNMNLNKISNFLLFSALSVGVLYLSYRYPFKINSSRTSPIYSNTPYILKITKYIIMMVFTFLILLFRTRGKYKKIEINYLVITLLLLLFPLLIEFPDWSIQTLKFVFWSLEGVIIMTISNRVDFFKLSFLIKTLLYISITAGIIQLFLFISIGRLPALAYPGTLSIRFGSFLDAPNSFAGICFLLIGWSFYHYIGIRRIVALTLMSIFLLLTQSWTALIFAILVGIIGLILRELKKPGTLLLTLFFAVILAINALIITSNADIVSVFNKILQGKMGSIKGHEKIIAAFSHISLTKFLFGSWGDSFHYYESWWGSSIINFGFLWTFAFAVLTLLPLLLIYNRLKLINNRKEKAVYFGFYLYCLYFIVGSLNLPFFEIYPNNFIFFIMITWIILDRKSFTLSKSSLSINREEISSCHD